MLSQQLASHAQLNLTKVNTYGLLYEWEGMDTSLKPLLLTAHQGKEILNIKESIYKQKLSWN